MLEVLKYTGAKRDAVLVPVCGFPHDWAWLTWGSGQARPPVGQGSRGAGAQVAPAAVRSGAVPEFPPATSRVLLPPEAEEW